MKNIVICCDGTWNTPDQKKDGVADPTNVVRIFNATAELGNDGSSPQHKYYHPGVGTDGSLWDKVVGGGTGRGLNRNIMGAYRELCDFYEDGDQIFMFGFSRGAYTVRSLCGLIAHAGLLKTSGLKDDDVWNKIERIFQKGYRSKTEDQATWRKLEWAFHGKEGEAIPIHFLGVWDTVGALGIPDDLAFLNLIDNLHDYTFHDTRLNPSIKVARHAVAMDEMRAAFQPTLWVPGENQDAEQVWFAGVHSDVGGGYPETGLSDCALMWMIKEAEACGLSFNDKMVAQIQPDHLGVIHDSCSGVFGLLPTQPRSVSRLAPSNPLISPTALDRHVVPPIHQSPYRLDRSVSANDATTCNIFARQIWNETGIWLEAGTKYQFTAEGEWLDSSIKCDAGGTDDGHFQFAELAQMAGSVLGQVENLFKKLTNNKAADFRFTKRHEDYPWFSLIGAIANGRGVDSNGHLIPHETFLIGKGKEYTPLKSGYFYAYANDAWNCYGNNRGRVRLTVKTA